MVNSLLVAFTAVVFSWGAKRRSEKMCSLCRVSGKAAIQIQMSARIPEHTGERRESKTEEDKQG